MPLSGHGSTKGALPRLLPALPKAIKVDFDVCSGEGGVLSPESGADRGREAGMSGVPTSRGSFGGFPV